MWTDGGAGVWRSGAQSVGGAMGGQEINNRRGAGVERSEGYQVECSASATAYRR